MFPLFRDCPNPLFEQNEHWYLPDYNELNKKGYQVLPLVAHENPLYDIVYADDLCHVTDLIYKEDQEGKKVNMRMLGRYKSTCWSFQKECRFIFSFKPEKHVKETFFDVMLSMHVFNDIEILLGPCVTEAERLIVEALMGRYLHRMDCKKSVFTGLVNE